MLADRGWAREDHLRLLDRDPRSAGYPIQVPVVDVVEIGNGGGSIAWVDDFGRLYVGRSRRARCRARQLRPRRERGDDDRRQPRTRPDQSRLLLRRRAQGRHGRCSTHARRDRAEARRRYRRGGARRRPDREQQHDQRAEAGLGEPRLRPARLHARRVRRRRRDARGGARDGSSGSARS